MQTLGAALKYREDQDVVRAAGLGQAQHLERGQPVDRLGDPGRLLHVGVAHPRDRVGDLDRKHLRCAGHAPADDLHLALARRIVDPLVQTAALDRVVQIAGAVGGQHDRRMGRPHGHTP